MICLSCFAVSIIYESKPTGNDEKKKKRFVTFTFHDYSYKYILSSEHMENVQSIEENIYLHHHNLHPS